MTWAVHAGEFPITTQMQCALHKAGQWTSSNACSGTDTTSETGSTDPSEPNAERRGLAEEKAKKLEPQWCFALRLPSETCIDTALGIVIDKDFVETLGEISKSPLYYLLSKFLVALGVQHVSMGMSLGRAYDLPLTFYEKGEFHREKFPIHFYFGMSGELKLPIFKKDSKAQDIIRLGAEIKRGWNLGPTVRAAEHALDSLLSGTFFKQPPPGPDKILPLVLSYCGIFPEATNFYGGLFINTKSMTYSMVKGYDLGGIEVSSMTLPYDSGRRKAGFYLAIEQETSVNTRLAYQACNAVSGVLKSVSSSGCGPVMKAIDSKAKFGLSITKNRMEVEIRAVGKRIFFCRFSGLFSSKPSMRCRVLDFLFEILADAAGFVVNKLEQLGDEIVEAAMVVGEAVVGATEAVGDGVVGAAEEVARIPRDAVEAAEGLGQDIGIAAKLSLGASEKFFQSIAKSLTGAIVGGSKPRDVLQFNFLERRKCVGDKHILFDSGPDQIHEYQHYFNQAGTDETKASCFQACYTHFQEMVDMPFANSNRDLVCPNGETQCKRKKLVGHSDFQPCCSHHRPGENRRICKAGYWGSAGNANGEDSATTSFRRDYDELVATKENGEECDRDGQCYSGFCKGNICLSDCDKDNKCFPGNLTDCHGHDNACLNMLGAYHFCDQESQTCEGCNDFYDHQPLEKPGVYTIRMAGSGRYFASTSPGNDFKVETTSNPAADVSEFEIVHVGGYRYYARNLLQNSFLYAAGNDSKNIKGDHWLRDLNGREYFEVKHVGCGRYLLKFGADAYIRDKNGLVTWGNEANADTVTFEWIAEPPWRRIPSGDYHIKTSFFDEDWWKMIDSNKDVEVEQNLGGDKYNWRVDYISPGAGGEGLYRLYNYGQNRYAKASSGGSIRGGDYSISNSDFKFRVIDYSCRSQAGSIFWVDRLWFGGNSYVMDTGSGELEWRNDASRGEVVVLEAAGNNLSANHAPMGNVEIRNGEVITGWACDEDDPTEHVRLDMYFGDAAGTSAYLVSVNTEYIASCGAQIEGICGLASESHCFEVLVNDDMREAASNGDGNVHVYAIDTAGTENQLLARVPLART